MDNFPKDVSMRWKKGNNEQKGVWNYINKSDAIFITNSIRDTRERSKENLEDFNKFNAVESDNGEARLDAFPTIKSFKSYAQTVKCGGAGTETEKVLDNSINHVSRRVSLNVAGNGWLYRSAVAKLQRLISIDDLEVQMARMGLVNIDVKAMGGRSVILTCPKEESEEEEEDSDEVEEIVADSDMGTKANGKQKEVVDERNSERDKNLVSRVSKTNGPFDVKLNHAKLNTPQRSGSHCENSLAIGGPEPNINEVSLDGKIFGCG
ncbi:hypothetical protein RHMOL_Rhmol09G0087300 [Rhododendron molle]|uniref:Uncharacterized protein n=1 Tax=Rhododendron molle TaxID=49168 RepID=A0ACC0MB39_RHOML|nr:hypothetical protein RHMOL_Rhmol09G0087300 [Rhododendron molle]